MILNRIVGVAPNLIDQGATVGNEEACPPAGLTRLALKSRFLWRLSKKSKTIWALH